MCVKIQMRYIRNRLNGFKIHVGRSGCAVVELYNYDDIFTAMVGKDGNFSSISTLLIYWQILGINYFGKITKMACEPS